MEKKEEDKEKKLSIRDADIVLGIILFGFFGWTAFESFRMSKERIDKGMATIYTAPGLVPLVISVLLLICIAYVIVYSFKKGGSIRVKDYLQFIKNSFSREETRSTFMVFLLLIVYIYLLIGKIPFIPATLIYMLSFLFLMKAGKPIVITVIGVFFSVAIVLFFYWTVGTYFPVGLFWW